ncbi:MAG TPA: hypothetical protein PK857_09865, partial [Hyphomicrobium sp.]|nr:hypothetical protein [Hyphomicrobium sp.]
PSARFMTSKDPRAPSASKEARLASALRENLARRKALQRAKRTRDANAPETPAAAPSPTPGRKDEPHA